LTGLKSYHASLHVLGHCHLVLGHLLLLQGHPLLYLG
jgi:hypothetical protein